MENERLSRPTPSPESAEAVEGMKLALERIAGIDGMGSGCAHGHYDHDQKMQHFYTCKHLAFEALAAYHAQVTKEGGK